MTKIKVWIDQLLEKVLNENDHSHLGKLKWLTKFRKYINSKEEHLLTQENDKTIVNSEGNIQIIDKIVFSSTPEGSVSLQKSSKKKKRKFFARKNKSRGA